MGTAAALDNRIAITGGSITGATPGRTVVKLFSPFTFAYSNGAAMPTALIKHTVLRTYDATNHQLIALVGGTTVNALSSYSSSAPAFTQSTVANGAPLGACGAVAGCKRFSWAASRRRRSTRRRSPTPTTTTLPKSAQST